MKKMKPFYITMLVIEVLLFALAGYSLIMCFVVNAGDDSVGVFYFEIAYLFIQLIAIGAIFYLTFRAMMKGSAIMSGIMVKDYNKKNIKAIIISGIIGGISLIVGIYFTLMVFGLNLPLKDILAYVIPYDIMNAMLLLSFIAWSFFIFPFIYKEDPKHKKSIQ